MDEKELMAEIEKVEASLPHTYNDLIQQIDRFIFGAQKGFDLCTELLCLCFENRAAHLILHKKAFKLAYNTAEQNNLAATSRKEYANANSIDEECNLILADTKVDVARFKRDRFIERLNSFKKIKGENINARGAG